MKEWSRSKGSKYGTRPLGSARNPSAISALCPLSAISAHFRQFHCHSPSSLSLSLSLSYKIFSFGKKNNKKRERKEEWPREEKRRCSSVGKLPQREEAAAA